MNITRASVTLLSKNVVEHQLIGIQFRHQLSQTFFIEFRTFLCED